MAKQDQSRRFTKVNESFTCENCQALVPASKKTCRNHCPHCLNSRHVDVFPGDRSESCKGLMPAFAYELEARGEIVSNI